MNIHKLRWILVSIRVVVVVPLLRGSAFTFCLIPSADMENPIFQGERILVNKWSYGLRVPFTSLFPYHRWYENPVRQQDIVVFNNPTGIRESIIGRREIYISRCLRVPGDTLLVDSLFSVISPGAQFSLDKEGLYSYLALREDLITSLMHTLSVTNDGLIGSNDSTYVRSLGRYGYYLLEQVMNGKENFVQPLSNREDAEPNPLIVPGKEKFTRIYPWSITLPRNTLVIHEDKQAEIKNDILYIDGKPTQHCYFTKDYHWMGSNNTINFSNSRLFRLVPRDRIIEKTFIIWFSKEKEAGLFDGYRWNRSFRTAK